MSLLIHFYRSLLNIIEGINMEVLECLCEVMNMRV